MHYNSDDSYLFVNRREIHKLKAGNKNVKFSFQFCLDFNFGYLDSDELSLKQNVFDFSVDYNSIDKSDMLNIHKSLMTKNNIKYCSTCLLYY